MWCRLLNTKSDAEVGYGKEINIIKKETKYYDNI